MWHWWQLIQNTSANGAVDADKLIKRPTSDVRSALTYRTQSKHVDSVEIKIQSHPNKKMCRKKPKMYR